MVNEVATNATKKKTIGNEYLCFQASLDPVFFAGTQLKRIFSNQFYVRFADFFPVINMNFSHWDG